MNEDKIIEKLEGLDKRLDKHDQQFDRVIGKLVEHDEKLIAHDQQFDRVINKLVEHDDRLDRIEKNMATKDDFRELKGILESLVTIVKKIQEDNTFSIEWVKRLQTELDEQKQNFRKQEEEIRKIKMQLKMA